jgi:hypothetical protein
VHPHPDGILGVSISAAIVRGGEIVKRVELGGPRILDPRLSGDGTTLVGYLDLRDENLYPRGSVCVIERDNGERAYLSMDEMSFDREVAVLQPHENAEIV